MVSVLRIITVYYYRVTDNILSLTVLIIQRLHLITRGRKKEFLWCENHFFFLFVNISEIYIPVSKLMYN